MDKLYIDFETYSECDILTKGGVAYARHQSTMPLCLAYAFNDEEVHLWTLKSGDLPVRIYEHIHANGKVVAFNATFEWRIWNTICARDLNWPLLSLDQMIDAQALAQTYTLHGNLADACEDIKSPIRKNTRGKALIKLLCQPNSSGQQPMPYDSRYKAAFLEFYQYCKDDVDSMRSMIKKLPRQELLPKEHDIWKLTVMMNDRGLPVSFKDAEVISSYVTRYAENELKVLPHLTKHAVSTIGQIAKIVAWCKTQGFDLPNLQARTLTEVMILDEAAQEDKLPNDPRLMPDNVRQILTMRQELGRTSTAKYKKLLNLAVQDEETQEWFVHDNLKFHGAGPGRWTGMGFQMHNLPRATCPNPDKIDQDIVVQRYIQEFYDQTIKDPMFFAKALVRPMIKAPKGYMLMVSDYHSIENILLHWIAGDHETLQKFREGFDQYVEMASARYCVHYNAVTKAQRQMGKVIILGCGYQMGAKKFVETAKLQFQMIISPEEGKAAVDSYRSKYYLVKALWDDLKRAAVRAVITGQKQTVGLITFGTATVNGVRWLAMRLPSGKSVYYMSPMVEELFIPEYEEMGRVPTITHWGINSYSKKWSRLKLIPGRITENAVQGTARETMAQGMLNVENNMPEVILIGTVHDEALSLIRERDITDDSISIFNKHLCSVDWLGDCPVTANGYIAKHYKKE